MLIYVSELCPCAESTSRELMMMQKPTVDVLSLNEPVIFHRNVKVQNLP